MNTTVILGAGFSKNSGIPIQSEIPEYLISDEVETFEGCISKVLERFLNNTFGYRKGQPKPNLDDVFTCIDISTSSGHHLGLEYSPLKLRAIRRFLVYKVYSIIEEEFEYSKPVEMLLKRIFDSSGHVSFVVLNWDTALEKYLRKINQNTQIEYCCNGKPLRYTSSQENIRIPVLKIHGSCNWLYCDNCRSLYYDLFDEVPLEKRSGFLETDFDLLQQNFSSISYDESKFLESCKLCGNYISSHIATFSYRKSFRTNSFSNIWSTAEKVLTDSDKWIFIGYSLPDSDYEFKHLLKIAELKLRHLKNSKLAIDLVMQNSDSAIEKYKKFFGDKLNIICNEGIEGYIN